MKTQEFALKAEEIKLQLYRTAFLYMGNEHDALEAVSETIFKGFRSAKTLREPSFFTTWLTRILINTCNTHLKKRKREVTMESLPELESDEFDKLPLKEALKKLPDQLRVVISLRFFSDLTLEETAKTLNLPRGTVTSRQTKALSLLKLELLEKEESTNE